MTDISDNLGNEIESKVLLLLKKLNDSESEKENLQAEIKRLKDELREAHAELVGLQKKYDNLQLAHASIHLSKNDVKTARKRMTDIIQKVDYCIAKLSE